MSATGDNEGVAVPAPESVVEIPAESPSETQAQHLREDSPSSGGGAKRFWPILYLLLLLFSVFLVREPTLNQKLQEAHGFRQTQTAITTQQFHEHGISWLHPKTPVLGVKGEAPFEFPLFQATATIPVNLGLNIDESMRATALACFGLSTIFIFLLTRRMFNSLAAVLASAWFCFAPFSFLWSRTSLIEFMAVAGGVGMAWAYIVYRDTKNYWFLAAGIFLGSAGMLTKVTTAAFWFVPVFLYEVVGDTSLKAWIKNRLNPGLLLGVAIPFGLDILWNRHADAIKGSDPATSWLMGKNLHAWNFGTLFQRQQIGNWSTIFNRFANEQSILPAYVLLFLGLCLVVASKHKLRLLSILLICFMPPLVFFNLYVVHDYYLSGVLAQVSIMLGVMGAWIIMKTPKDFHDWPVRPLATGGLVLVCVFAIENQNIYVHVAYKKADPPGLAQMLAANTSPTETVIMDGFDWDPSEAYYSNRHAQMVPGGRVLPQPWVDELKNPAYKTMLLGAGITPLDLRIWSYRDWIVAVNQWIEKAGQKGDAFPSNAVVISSNFLPANVVPTTRAHSDARTLNCVLPLPGGTTQTLLDGYTGFQWFSVVGSVANPGPTQGAVGVDGITVPARKYIAVQGLPSTTIACSGGGGATLTPVGTSSSAN